jgi:thiamine biosynthesis lipoprotein
MPFVEPHLGLLRFTRQAMATAFDVFLPFGTAHAQAAAEAALDEIDRLEDQLSVFRPDSEVSRLNQRAAQGAVPLEKRLFELLQQAAQLHAATDGAFDITTGALTKVWGFHRREGRLPSDAELAATRARMGMQHVVLDPAQRTVRFLVPGLEINLGSIGKGYALDRAAAILRDEFGIRDALLSGGQSSILALGTAGEGQGGWEVGIRHPWKPARRLTRLVVRDRAVATSAASFQHFEHAGRKLGHLLDPRTGWPAEGLASATVLAPTAAEADALATAFFILGVEKAHACRENHPEVGALLLPEVEGARLLRWHC